MTVAEFQRVVVTGGAGFIGSNYVHRVLRDHPEWELVVLDKLTYAGNVENLRDVWNRISFVQGDIADPEVVRSTLAGADGVVNFAAESHVDRSLLDPRPFIRTNVEGTLVLLEEARRSGVRRFLHVSTDEVYGDVSHTDRHSLESDPMLPRSPYAASKAAAEHLVFAYGISYGLDVVITRGSNTYGPYQYPEKIIPLFITNALGGKRLPVYGDGSAIRDYMHAEDHAAGVDVVLHRGTAGEAYNLGAREQVNGVEVASRLLQLLEKPTDLIEFVTDRPGHDYRYSVDPSKAEALGWSRHWDFASGLADTVEWYLRNSEWWGNVRGGREFQQLQKDWYLARKL
jgi:dTDP-glucose 4,6-dehydratase